MKNIVQVTLICFAFFTAKILHAADNPLESRDPLTTINGILKNLITDNNAFSHSKSAKEFQALNKNQTPRATMVLCSDSRVHTHSFDLTPENDLFVIRNIGNQLETAEGSIEYGVEHLYTPLLIFIGHTNCGAIKAATGDYSALSAAIKHELQTIKLAKDLPVAEGVVTNIHQQVELASQKFANLIKQNKLVVVGAVYDFSNELGHGPGKLVLLNLNGEKDVSKIKDDVVLKGINNIHIGWKK
ncbi:MAG: carbonic anhydrase [Alphaproteobacteria bacterium]|nr:carbonic anhydrase [Alphaproteobacteria bacterium]